MRIRDRDLLTNTELGKTIQGHVGQNTKQVFQTLDGSPFSNERLKLAGYEFIQRDQFGNLYHLMRAVLFDGEMYDVAQWIKPSMMTKHGGGSAYFDDHAARQKLRVTEACLRELREVGAIALGRMNMEILRGRTLSNNPVAIETQDITHQSNVLAGAIETAKRAAGEEVPAGDIEAPTGELTPTKTKLAPIETTDGAKLILGGVGLTPPLAAPKTVPHEQIPG